jgi:hypothetical protein
MLWYEQALRRRGVTAHPATCTLCKAGMRPDPNLPGKHMNPETGIRPFEEWGCSCGRGFVSNARFGPNQPVIPRTSHATTRKWRAPDVQTKRCADA